MGLLFNRKNKNFIAAAVTAVFATAFLMAPSDAHATSPKTYSQDAFLQWIAQFEQRARGEGISEIALRDAFNNLTYNQKVIDLDGKQPEGTITFVEYREKILSPTRIRKGREMMAKHADLLARVSAEYNVQPQFIVALWGIETSYGDYTGGFDTIRSLATLAYEGRRRDFFEKELINALRIIDHGHIKRDDIKGSWAGALGQNQFMPSSFAAYAQDFNGDGKKDIWGSLPDVFASSANYLSRSGWKGDEKWGREVKLPAGFSPDMISLKVSAPLSQWAAQGVTLPDGSPIPVVEGMKASVVAPDGINGPAYLAYDNYKTIMKWNRSTYFATCVGLLSDLISY